jgi:hypothetical protein
MQRFLTNLVSLFRTLSAPRTCAVQNFLDSHVYLLTDGHDVSCPVVQPTRHLLKSRRDIMYNDKPCGLHYQFESVSTSYSGTYEDQRLLFFEVQRVSSWAGGPGCTTH